MNNELQFNSCQQCFGEGEKDGKNCPVCLGSGVWGNFSGKTIFFEREVSRFFILFSKLRNFFKIIFKIFLIIFAFGGIICFIQAVFSFDKLSKIFSPLDQPKNTLLLFFWFSLLGDLLLLYLKEQEKESKNLAKYFEKSEKININNFLDKASQEAIEASSLLAERLRHPKVDPIHLFVGILQQKDGAIITTRLGISWQLLKEKISQALDKIIPSYHRKKILFSPIVKKILFKAFLEAKEKKKESISPLRILFYLISDSEEIKLIFDDFEIKPNDIKNVIVWREVYEDLRKDWQKLARGAGIKGKSKMNVAMTSVATPFVDSFSQDLTDLAKKGYLAPCMDREKEVEEIFRILEGGQKNLVLVGPPGVGKTSIIEGIARKMISEEVPKVISDKRLISLSLSRLLAGAQPGEIGQRMQIILGEIIRAGNIILFIKDIHNMVGIKASGSELDVSEVLAEVLGKKYFMLLSTSIIGDYEKYLERSSLGHLLSSVKIEEPGKNETILILESKVASIEAKNRVFFSYQSLVEAVGLSQRYLYEKFLPEKAIALLEETAVYVKNKKGKNSFVLKEDVAELIAKKTGIPTEKISQTEATLLLDLETKIHQRIIDQNEAVKAVATAIKRARTELRDPRRPIVNLLFLGPTGVGKTELAKTVADIYFGSEKKMIRLDMSEFQTKESIGHLIGDSKEPRGILTEAVRKNPFTLLLLDEIEKAHPDVLNLFLQVMDDGRLTDWQGRTIDFTNLIFIGTSNAASAWLQEKIREGKAIEEIRELLIKEQLTPYFHPEFLNRFDSVIVFKPLGVSELKEIAKLLLASLKKTLEGKGIVLEVTAEAIEELAQQGFDPVFGARPLKRVIQEKVTDALANFLLTGQVSRRDVVILEKGGKIRVEKKE